LTKAALALGVGVSVVGGSGGVTGSSLLSVTSRVRTGVGVGGAGGSGGAAFFLTYLLGLASLLQ
jgi:hypothetical protein